MYKIHLGDKKEAKVVVYLDRIPLLRVPAYVLAGVGNKKKRYRAHLDKCFSENNDLLTALARLHLEGLEKGDISLICHPRHKEFHAAGIKDFLTENKDFLDSVIPYLFPGKKTPKQESQDLSKVMDQLPPELKAQLEETLKNPEQAVNNQPVAITEADMNIFRELIKQDQEKENVAKKAVEPQSDENTNS